MKTYKLTVTRYANTDTTYYTSRAQARRVVAAILRLSGHDNRQAVGVPFSAKLQGGWCLDLRQV